MTEKFSCPEPSEEARRAYIAALNVEPGTFSSVLAAAYAVDVPRIVRAEVERALRKRQEDPLNFGIAAYLAARFGEGEKRDGSDLPPTRECFHYWPKAGPGEKCEKCGYEWPWPTVYYAPSGLTPAERDFLRALAEEIDRTAPQHSRVLLAAARRVIEEAP